LDVNAGEAKVALLAMIFTLSHAPNYSYLKGILPLIKLDYVCSNCYHHRKLLKNKYFQSQTKPISDNEIKNIFTKKL
jgi:hypothetical protein